MSSNEQTPLITTVYVRPARPRYRHNIVRRFCTVALGSSFIFLVVLFLTPVAFLSHSRPHKHHPPKHGVNAVSFKELQQILLDTPESSKAAEWSRYYTSGPHLAGKNLSQAVWTQERWQEFGIQANIVAYDVYLNYPVGHRLALYEQKDGKKNEKASWKVKFEATLEEDVLEEDPSTALENRVPTFHGYSASGNVTAPFVYVNYGTFQDFEDLTSANISVKDKIVIARYGGIFRGLKIKRAQELGAVGVVLFTDPGDDGKLTVEHGVKPYPDGPARNPSSVQRGSTQFLSIAPGDP